MSNIADINKLHQLYDTYRELLTSKQQEYFHYYYFEDLSLAEISQNLGVSRNAVHSNIQNTIKLLKKYELYLNILDDNEMIYNELNALKNKYKINDDDLKKIFERLNK